MTNIPIAVRERGVGSCSKVHPQIPAHKASEQCKCTMQPLFVLLAICSWTMLTTILNPRNLKIFKTTLDPSPSQGWSTRTCRSTFCLSTSAVVIRCSTDTMPACWGTEYAYQPVSPQQITSARGLLLLGCVIHWVVWLICCSNRFEWHVDGSENGSTRTHL